VAATAGVGFWFPRMLVDFFEVGPAAGVLGLLAVGAFVTGPTTALFGAWLACLAQRGRAGPIAVGSGFAGAELLRAYGPIGAPWALSAYALAGSAWAQLAELVSAFGVGLLLAAGNAAVASLAVPALRPRTRRRAAALLCLFAASWAFGWLRTRTPSDAADAEVPVAVVQGGVTYPFRFDPARSQPSLERYLALTAEAAERRPALVFWPEHAIDFYLSDDGPERAALLAALAPLPVEVALGAPSYRRLGATARYRNSVYAVAGGRVGDRVDKAQLVPFAEVAPLPGLRAAGTGYEPGGARRPLATAVAPIGVLVCSEALFPGAARELARAGAALLFHPSNDYWMASREGAALMLRSAAFRAIEVRRWLVRATPTGVSALIDPAGRVVARAPYGEAAVLDGRVGLARGRTLYERVGDAPVLAAAAWGVMLAIAPRRGPRERSRVGTLARRRGPPDA
jgi:apolipoprotein N-acyltransferase